MYIYIYLSYCIIKTCVNLNGSFVLNCLAPRGPRAWRVAFRDITGAGNPEQDGLELLIAELARMPDALAPKAAQMLVPELRVAMFEIPWSLDMIAERDYKRLRETTYLYLIMYIYIYILYIIYIYIYIEDMVRVCFPSSKYFQIWQGIHWKGLGVSVLTLKGLETMESSGDGGRQVVMICDDYDAGHVAVDVAWCPRRSLQRTVLRRRHLLNCLPWFGCRACPMGISNGTSKNIHWVWLCVENDWKTISSSTISHIFWVPCFQTSPTYRKWMNVI